MEIQIKGVERQDQLKVSILLRYPSYKLVSVKRKLILFFLGVVVVVVVEKR